MTIFLLLIKMSSRELTNQVNLEIWIKDLKQKQRKDQQVSVLQKKKREMIENEGMSAFIFCLSSPP